MAHARAPYMAWAKNRAVPAVDLAGSNLLACTMEDLPGARELVDLSGESANGYPPLLQAIAARYGVPEDSVATAPGCSGANFLACAALLDAGDEVLVESPNYDPLPAAVRMLGATVTTFPRRFGEGYRIDPARVAAAMTPGTRALVISNPHNPSGAVVSDEQMRALGQVAARAGIHVLVDEVYLDTVLDGRPAPAATLSPVFVSTNSLTKAYGLSTLRCGWTLASREITERIRRARDIVDVSGAIPAERLAHVAFQNLDRLTARARKLVEQNASLVRSFLESRRELEFAPSRTTIVFPRFRDGRDAGPFVERLFAEHGVALVPGSFFDAPPHFRISFGGSTAKLTKGLEAVGRCLDDLTRRA
ncbi:MAG TPA: pyridoxal phosphate-dependent aminotransferase [Thermoanaerobaculia bacterium]|nr:pyridoxal phosphate-dependent aminotransferase [Thermoanaerobaculia bacterium]